MPSGICHFHKMKKTLIALLVVFVFGFHSVKAQAETIPIDVYLIAGQSNAAGYSTNNRSLLVDLDERFVHGFEDVLYYGKVNNERLYDLVNVKSGLGSGERIGPELGMAQVLSEHYEGKKTALIRYAVGGAYLADEPNHGVSTNFGTWSSPSMIAAKGGKKFTKSGLIYDTFLQTVADGIKALKDRGYQPTIKGIAWMQGCQDAWSATHAPQYAENLTLFIKDIREDLGKIMGTDLSRLPFAIGKIHPHYTATHVAKIREQQEIVLGSVEYTSRVETQGLTLPGTDNAHFNTLDMVKLGQDFAKALIGLGRLKFLKVVVGEGGAVLGGGMNIPGENVQLTAVPEKGYRLSRALKISGSSEIDITSEFENNQCSFLMPDQDMEIRIEFSPLPSYAVTLKPGEGGGIYRSISTRNPFHGETIVFTVKAKEGYEISSFKINGAELALSENGTYTLEVMEDLIVEAHFQIIESDEEPEPSLPVETKGCRLFNFTQSMLMGFGFLYFFLFRREKLDKNI